MSNSKEFKILLNKYLNNDIDENEFSLFLAMLSELEEEEVQDSFLTSILAQDNIFEQTVPERVSNKLDNIWIKINEDCLKESIVHLPNKTRIIRFNKWLAVAAALILVFGFFLYNYHLKNTQSAFVTTEKIIPAINSSRITLVSGKVVEIDTSAKGTLFQDNSTKIIRNENDEIKIEYLGNQETSEEFGEVLTTSIETSTGGYTKFILPDGSKVFLNAKSSLHFPVKFLGTSREVMLEGEGYFEIAHNKDLPFRVNSQGQVVEVLGTKFNIRSYPDETEKVTTLTEGRIKISNNQNKFHFDPIILKPGMQFKILENNVSVQEVNTQEFVGWVNKRFMFNSIPLPVLMKEIERWYDVEFVYDSSINLNVQLYGNLARNTTLNKFIELLELNTGYKFSYKERRIYMSR